MTEAFDLVKNRLLLILAGLSGYSSLYTSCNQPIWSGVFQWFFTVFMYMTCLNISHREQQAAGLEETTTWSFRSDDNFLFETLWPPYRICYTHLKSMLSHTTSNSIPIQDQMYSNFSAGQGILPTYGFVGIICHGWILENTLETQWWITDMAWSWI